MVISDKNLSKLLLEDQFITTQKLNLLLKKVKSEHVSLAKIVVDNEIVSESELARLIADYLNIPFVDLSEIAIPSHTLNLIPEVFAKKKQTVAFKQDQKGLHVAMLDPTDLETINLIYKSTGLPVIAYLTIPKNLENSLLNYNQDIQNAFDQVISNSIKETTSIKDEPPIIKMFSVILTYAQNNKASDIHIEPTDNYSLVRFRIDGILHDIVDLPISIHSRIITHIKVLSKLRTDEHAAPQDGKISWINESNERLDLRVSIIPINRGEKAVLRLLSAQARQLSLVTLGFSPSDLNKVKNAYTKPYGMILSTGPTGSGKTTTLYAILGPLNKRNVNITTIEDPVEYDVPGVNQIQVNPKTNLTFASGLRSIVRQDPDIILVGEIRDKETASIAVNSAMTGHLVLSTLHTNDAATAIPRLLDLKVEPFLVSSTVNVVIAQRLVRKNCLKCRSSREIITSDLEKYFKKDTIVKNFKGKKTIRIYENKGCPVCHNTGYTGRIGIYEVLVVTDEIRSAINSHQDAATIAKLAIKAGMTTMLEDGLNKVIQGITSIEEIIRVTKE